MHNKNNDGMERLDQGHLQPELEVPGLTCPGREIESMHDKVPEKLNIPKQWHFASKA
jgi:hypothetical protein